MEELLKQLIEEVKGLRNDLASYQQETRDRYSIIEKESDARLENVSKMLKSLGLGIKLGGEHSGH